MTVNKAGDAKCAARLGTRKDPGRSWRVVVARGGVAAICLEAEGDDINPPCATSLATPHAQSKGERKLLENTKSWRAGRGVYIKRVERRIGHRGLSRRATERDSGTSEILVREGEFSTDFWRACPLFPCQSTG